MNCCIHDGHLLCWDAAVYPVNALRGPAVEDCVTRTRRNRVSVRRAVTPEATEEAAASGYKAVGKSRPWQRSQVAEEPPATAHLAQHTSDRRGAPAAAAGRLDQPDPSVDVVLAQTEPLDEPGLLVGERRHTAGGSALGREPRAASSKASGPVEDQQDWLSRHRVQP